MEQRSDTCETGTCVEKGAAKFTRSWRIGERSDARKNRHPSSNQFERGEGRHPKVPLEGLFVGAGHRHSDWRRTEACRRCRERRWQDRLPHDRLRSGRPPSKCGPARRQPVAIRECCQQGHEESASVTLRNSSVGRKPVALRRFMARPCDAAIPRALASLPAASIAYAFAPHQINRTPDTTRDCGTVRMRSMPPGESGTIVR